MKNVDNLFIAKTCQAYLLSARMIFDKNLHDMVQVRISENRRIPLLKIGSYFCFVFRLQTYINQRGIPTIQI